MNRRVFLQSLPVIMAASVALPTSVEHSEELTNVITRASFAGVNGTVIDYNYMSLVYYEKIEALVLQAAVEGSPPETLLGLPLDALA